MANIEKPILRRHHLSHIPEITVDDNIFTTRLEGNCSMMNCDSNCCKGGVWADVKEREKILNHTDLILRTMEPQQLHDPSQWFDGEEADDPDFPSGRAVGTLALENGCVFLNRTGRCVLQIAEREAGTVLKPFFCTAFPITIEYGVLTYDDEVTKDHGQCCTPKPGGQLTVFDVCQYELDFVLGKDGAKELSQLAENRK